VNLAALWQELEDDYAALQHGPGVALRFEPVGCAALWSDRRKLKIILKNLIGNALKFTPVGEVVASCHADASCCTFTVRDTGIGIPETSLPDIFDMFRQVDSSDARSYGGAGLGLYIVQRLLAQLRGHVAVTSSAGAGSTFTVTLPLRARDGVADTAVELADGVLPRRTVAAAG
jgi:signal transduction histidine kinase